MNRKHYFLVGIGGISMSGIAKLLKLSGNIVSGSDIKENDEIEILRKMGIKVIIGQSEKNISSNIDELIYTSPAINFGSPGKIEIDKAKKLNIPIYKRSEFIGKLMKNKIGISISGMHGKTTITAMLGYVLKILKQNPLVLVGGEFRGFSNQNLEYPKIGYKKSKYFVSEACEYDRSFLDFKTQIGIISNIEEEHLDYFKGGLAEILETFKKFITQIPKKGFIVVNGDDKNIKKIINSARCEVIPYFQKELNDFPDFSNPKTRKEIGMPISNRQKIQLKIPGIHNKLNALAVLKLTEKLGFSKFKVLEILENFTGVSRRFEYLGNLPTGRGKTIFVDDYAHHPTEIKATLKSAREFYGNKKIFVIFQPHQYSRTKLLLNDFSQSFGDADFVGITDVYEVAGREEDKSVGSKQLAEKISKNGQKVIYLPTYKNVYKYIKENFSKYDVVMTMGAGPINSVAKKFIEMQNSNIKMT